jgi:hypothetical protein
MLDENHMIDPARSRELSDRRPALGLLGLAVIIIALVLFYVW